MYPQVVHFIGEGYSPREAAFHASTDLNKWLRETQVDLRDIHHMSHQMIPATIDSELTWHYLIALYLLTPQGVDMEQARRYRPKETVSLRQRTQTQERAMVRQANTRAARLDATGEFSYEEWQALCVHFGNMCLSCQKDFPLTIDHVIPLTEGGANDIRNIQPLCKSCNSRKGTNTIDYRDSESLEAFLNSLE